MEFTSLLRREHFRSAERFYIRVPSESSYNIPLICRVGAAFLGNC
jgi:hypothetical protein